MLQEVVTYHPWRYGVGSTHNCKDGSIIHVSLELGQQRSMVNVPVNFHCKHCMTVKEDDTVTNVHEMDHPVGLLGYSVNPGPLL